MIELRKCDEKGIEVDSEILKTFNNTKEADQYMKDNYEFNEINGMWYHYCGMEIVAVTYRTLGLQLRKVY